MSLNRLFGLAAIAVVVCGLVLAFAFLGTPGRQRLISLDDLRLKGLQEIAHSLHDRYQGHGLSEKLPESALAVAGTSLRDYQYRRIDATHYMLCTTFATNDGDDQEDIGGWEGVWPPRIWRHGAGHACYKLDATEQTPMPMRSQRPTDISTDGEATAYLTDDFSGDFDLKYDATLAPAPSNRSWSLVGVMLKGRTAPAWIEIGLARGDPDAATLTAFTAASTSTAKRSWNPVKAECAPSCVIELKGNRNTLYAFVNGRKVEALSRLSLPIVKPYVQLNAEVNAVGDIISARLALRSGLVAGTPLQSPTCAFTTQGIEAKLLSPTVLAFSGQFRTGARVTYVSLVDGMSEERCPDS